jgi:hypothetical protein
LLLDDPDESPHVSGGIHSFRKLINLVPGRRIIASSRPKYNGLAR